MGKKHDCAASQNMRATLVGAIFLPAGARLGSAFARVFMINLQNRRR